MFGPIDWSVESQQAFQFAFHRHNVLAVNQPKRARENFLHQRKLRSQRHRRGCALPFRTNRKCFGMSFTVPRQTSRAFCRRRRSEAIHANKKPRSAVKLHRKVLLTRHPHRIPQGVSFSVSSASVTLASVLPLVITVSSSFELERTIAG